MLKNGYGIIVAAFLGTVSTKAIGKKRKEKQMNANAMKVYRYGRMGTYWDAQGKPQHGLVPADRTSSMWYADVYRHACYYDRRSAEAGLAQVKADCRARAEAAAQVLAADPAMAQRMRDGMATQEDARKPSYDAFSTALRAQELWAFVEGMQVLATTHGITVCRLNTLPDGDNEWSRGMREEIEAVMRHYGECVVEWSCMGHTRAEWQSAAVAQWVTKAHPEWTAKAGGGRCSIKA